MGLKISIVPCLPAALRLENNNLKWKPGKRNGRGIMASRKLRISRQRITPDCHHRIVCTPANRLTLVFVRRRFMGNVFEPVSCRKGNWHLDDGALVRFSIGWESDRFRFLSLCSGVFGCEKSYHFNNFGSGLYVQFRHPRRVIGSV